MKRLILLLPVLFALYTYAQPSGLFHSNFATREKLIDSVFKTQSDEIIKDTNRVNSLIATYIAKAKENDDDNLLEHLELEQYRYRLRINEGTSKTDIEDPANLIKKFSSDDKPYFEVAAMQAYANYLHAQNRNYGRVFELYIEAYYKYENFTVEEFPHKIDYIYNIGIAYYQFNDFINTIRYLRIAVDQASNLYENYTGLMNTLALSYRELGKYDSAMVYFRKLNEYAIKNNATNWILISRLNIGHTYYLQHNYSMAKKEMAYCHDYAVSSRQRYGISESGILLAKMAQQENNYAEAERWAIESYHVWKEKFGSTWIYERMEAAKDIYSILADVNAHKGNYALAYKYRDTSIYINDTLDKLYNTLQLSTAQHKVVLNKYEQEKQAFQFERKKQSLIRNTLLIIIFMSSIIALLFINNQRLKRKKLEADKLNAENKLKDFTKTLQQKTEMIEQVSRELEQIKVRKDEDEQNDTIVKLQQSTILTDDEWDEFRNMFEQVHKGFLNRLKQKLPDLTPAEIRFMVLSKLKLSPKDMANVLGVGPSAIRKYRYRLRNKLSLPEDGSIDEVVDMI